MIAVFSPQPAARLHYTLKLLFTHLLKVKYSVIEEEEAFAAAQGFRINYSHRDIPADLHWRPHEIMERRTIDPVEVEVRNWNDMPVLFPRPEKDWPFDLFAAIFFLASRYEEYLPHKADKHYRFTAEESTAFTHDFLHRPLINEWAKVLREFISEKMPQVVFGKSVFTAEATFDIDVAWAYRNKGWWRTAGAFAMDVAKGKYDQLSDRWSVLTGGKKDPYDTYAYIHAQTEGLQISTRYFFLLGDYSSYDRNSKATLSDMQALIRQCAAHGKVGIHPSYGSHRSVNQLAKEIERLRKITGENVTDSRQHYLKMTLPETYQRLIDTGIRADYTMGYAQQAGFRASLCTPFPFFDLANDAETTLWLFPFAYMDGTLQHYQQLDISAAKKVVEQLVGAVHRVDGLFICLWHNSSLSEQREWSGWREVFEFTLKACSAAKDRSKLHEES